MTINAAYRDGLRRLEQDMPRDEAASAARQLLDFVTGLRYAHLLAPDQELSPTEEAHWRMSVDELAAGRPLAYILGTREFFGLTFHTDPRALIPRPETETLVEAAIARLRAKGPVSIADLGTGTGCIAISLAHALPHANLFATDVSPAALELAQENAAELGVAGHITFLNGQPGDWAAPLHGVGLLDVIVSNPPYIPTGDAAALQPQIRDWEPPSALYAGDDGLACYRELAAQCRGLLQPGGFLGVELGQGQFGAVRALFEAAGWMVEAPVYDLGGIERVLIAY